MTAIDGSIDVLLIDDDAQWGRLMVELLEQENDRLAVTTTTDGSRGLELLEERRIDCVVSDYRMPGVDGLEVLETLRGDGSDIPFIMITGQGTEEIASDAISLGITDYFRKDPSRGHAEILATRITHAVDRQRLEERLQRSRERFASLFENLPDPAVLVTAPDARIRTYNASFAAKFGVDGDGVIDEPLGELLESPSAMPEGESHEVGREVTHETVEGSREFLLRRFLLEGTDEPEYCYIYTDITERKQRTRELETERDIKEAIRDVLVTSSGRPEIETAYCRRLIETGEYEFVWIGELADADELIARCRAGEGDAYLDDISLERSGSTPAEPSVRAAVTEEPIVVRDTGALPDADWARAAREHGFRSTMAIPLTYEGLGYGVMAVYASEPSAFGPGRRELLTELAEALAYAIDAERQREALSSERTARFRLTVSDPDAPVVALGRALESETDDGGRVRVSSVIPKSGGTVLLFVETGASVEAFREAAATVPAVQAVDPLGNGTRLAVTVATPTIGSMLASLNASVDSITVDGGEAVAVASISNRQDLREVVEAVRDRYPGTSIDSFQTLTRGDEYGPRGALDRAALTEKQAGALEAAYQSGFFERPKRRSSEEIADSLGISRSTFLQHLRVAQQKLLGSYFDGQETPDRPF